ncbi:MAG: hypothetical protein DRJ97_02465 [Thermoprotei archaeon]|nr:MAG: hypothetical protein DRJ97_02465 [Thermoprotei archaeon]
MGIVEEAVEELRLGKPVLIYDWPDRESEVDMVFYAEAMTPDKVYKLRTEAGGLICYGTSQHVAKALGLPSFDEVLVTAGFTDLVAKVPSYGAKSNLAIWVNSVKVRTGISDVDRALTINSLHELVKLVFQGNVIEARRRFRSEFYAPGHVPVLVAKDLKDRLGHTELAVWLAVEAGLPPSVTYAEMLKFGSSMTLEEATEYARNSGLVLVKGDDILSYLGGRRP